MNDLKDNITMIDLFKTKMYKSYLKNLTGKFIYDISENLNCFGSIAIPEADIMGTITVELKLHPNAKELINNARSTAHNDLYKDLFVACVNNHEPKLYFKIKI